METIWSDSGRLTWPRDPHGYRFIGRAIEQLGPLTDAEWASGDAGAVFECRPAAPSKPQKVLGGRSFNSGPPRQWFDELTTIYNIALKQWEILTGDIDARNKLVAPAVKRFDTVCNLIIDEAEAGRVSTAYREATGEMNTIEPKWWNGDLLGYRFLSGKLDPMAPMCAPSSSLLRRNWIFLSTADLEHLVRRLQNLDGNVGQPHSVVSPVGAQPTDAEDAKVARAPQRSARGALPFSAKPNDRKYADFAHAAAMIIRNENVGLQEAFRRVAPQDAMRKPESIVRAIRQAFDLMYDRDGSPHHD